MTNTSTRPIARIHNVVTNEIIDREMNDAEFAQWQTDQELFKSANKAKAKANSEKAALLARLGLTEDELKIILG
jgi:hypothetical protein